MEEYAQKRCEEGMEDVLDMFMPGWKENPSTQDTNKRFIKYLKEYDQPIDVEGIFRDFKLPDDAVPCLITQVPIPFRMICEHHLLPATGTAALCYIPKEKVLGLSKLSRLVDAVGTEKPTLQEYAADRILKLMNDHLAPQGVMVVIKATHGCMSCRGVNKPGVNTITSSVSGVFHTNHSARMEAMSLVIKEL